MTKDKIISESLNRIQLNDGTNEIGEYMSNAMDEWAKQQAIAFALWISDNELEGNSEQLYDKFIQSQNNG